jgi:hypothetical protein
LQFVETRGGAWLGRWVLDWEDGVFAVVEAHRTESEVFPDPTVLWSILVPSWVAPLEVCVGIAMVTGYGHVLWGLAGELCGGRGVTCLGEVSAAKRGALVALAAS